MKLQSILSMTPPIQRDENNLNQVAATILSFVQELGVYHYNKLIYLFEYFHIKNFGKRYTQELFIKYPHGPVIINYKGHIESLVDKHIANTDITKLQTKRCLDEGYGGKISIYKAELTENFTFRDVMLLSFTRELCDKFSTMSVESLESFVYSTAPMKNYVNSLYKKETGGYILTSDCIKISDHRNPTTEGRRKALLHLQTYPEIDYAQHRQLAEEFAPLSSLRPSVA
ncbi:MAG: DUF4065 domain-containing protein [Ignavibacteriales bacterium]|nr:DUF4065 domain-containing protein [Ignavibacteriales bacterium]